MATTVLMSGQNTTLSITTSRTATLPLQALRVIQAPLAARTTQELKLLPLPTKTVQLVR